MEIVALVKLVFPLTALAVFTGLALWDVSLLISDYIYDNRLTLTRLVTVNGSFLYLEDPLLCVSPVNYSIFQQQWNTNKIDNETSEGASNSFLNELVAVSKFVTSMSKIDYAFVTSPEALPDLSLANDTNLHNFLIHPNASSRIDNIWTGLKNTLVQEMYDVQKIRKAKEAVLEMLSDKAVCFSLPLKGKLSSDLYMVRYAIDLSEIDYSPQSIDSKAAAAIVEVHFSDYQTTLQNAADKSLITEVQITNFGTYDTTGFPPCTNRFSTEWQCWQDSQISILAEVCDCIPIKYRSLFVKSKVTEAKKSFCTIKNYEKCWHQANERASSYRSANADQCKPCISYKNNYFVSSYLAAPNALQQLDTNESFSPKSIITFSCKDRFYPLFQEKTQFTFSQLISQIGGDLGLYTGFSLISLVQAITFVFALWQGRCCRSSKSPRNRPAPTKKLSIFKLITTYFHQKRHNSHVDRENADFEMLTEKVQKLEQLFEKLDAARYCRKVENENRLENLEKLSLSMEAKVDTLCRKFQFKERHNSNVVVQRRIFSVKKSLRVSTPSETGL